MTARLFAMLLAAATMLLVSLATGGQLYYLLFYAIALTILSGLVSALLALFTVSVSLSSKRRSVRRGDVTPVVITARHWGFMPVGRLRLTLAVPDDARAKDAIDLPPLPLRRHVIEYAFQCPHRGAYTVGVSSIDVRDAFGLFAFSRAARGMSFRVDVKPRTYHMEPLDLQAGDGGQDYRSRASEDNASPSDVRTWQDGDALKKVHWKLSMRKRELMVRTYEESMRPDTLILIDLSPVKLPRGHALTVEDAACELAASVALAQLEAGYPVRMPLMSRHPSEPTGQSAAEFTRFMAALTQVRFDSPYPYERVLTLEMRRMQRTGGAVLITPMLDARIADVAMQLKRYGMRVMVFWVAEIRRKDTPAVLTELNLAGVRARRVDPWSIKPQASA